VGRTFVLIAEHAQPDPSIPLADLTGRGGRFDLVARFVNAALLTSHGIREDARALAAFTQPSEPIGLRVDGGQVTGIGPDERSTAARLQGALEAIPMPVWQAVADGIEVRTGDLATLLDDEPDPLVLLREDGDLLEPAELDDATFVFGDHEGFVTDRRKALAQRADVVARLGEQALQADQLAAVLHHELDRS
jgi:tRNA (pseudouridine54-N1)-methyltransferase